MISRVAKFIVIYKYIYIILIKINTNMTYIDMAVHHKDNPNNYRYSDYVQTY